MTKPQAMGERLALAWSGGKDSALTLGALRRAGREPMALLTTMDETNAEVTMHRVPRALVEAQAAAAGIPLVEVEVPWPCPNETYEERMAGALEAPPLADVPEIAFGDLFLADIRAYREERLGAVGRRATFPLWLQPTDDLARRFVDDGFVAVVVAVDSEQLDGGFTGRTYDAGFLDDLPDGVDPCGENGEFHTFVYAGPIFRAPIRFRTGAVHTDGRFTHLELFPG